MFTIYTLTSFTGIFLASVSAKATLAVDTVSSSSVASNVTPELTSVYSPISIPFFALVYLYNLVKNDRILEGSTLLFLTNQNTYFMVELNQI